MFHSSPRSAIWLGFVIACVGVLTTQRIDAQDYYRIYSEDFNDHYAPDKQRGLVSLLDPPQRQERLDEEAQRVDEPAATELPTASLSVTIEDHPEEAVHDSDDIPWRRTDQGWENRDLWEIEAPKTTATDLATAIHPVLIGLLALLLSVGSLLAFEVS